MAWMSASRRGGAALAAIAGLLVAGCGDQQANAPAFVGRLTDQGEDAVIGAVSDGAGVSFYVCGGDTSYATMTRWIHGSASPDGALDLTSGAWHVTGNLEKGAGHLETDQGHTLAWTVRPAAGALEGLYQAMDGSCRTGAVVGDFGDGRGTRLQGTWCDGATRFAQVTPIKNPLTLMGQGIADIAVKVETTPSRTLVVTRLLAPLPAQ